MENSDKGCYMIVTFRVKRELYDEYKIAMIKAHTTPTANLVFHINEQIKNYQLPESKPMEIAGQEYVKVNFRIKRDVYAEYKIAMIKAHTTPTADITRHILKTVENYHMNPCEAKVQGETDIL